MAWPIDDSEFDTRFQAIALLILLFSVTCILGVIPPRRLPAPRRPARRILSRTRRYS
jgi:hypothetical protein